MYLSKKLNESKTWLFFLVTYAIYTIALIIEINYIFTDQFYADAFVGTDATQKDITNFINNDRSQDWINFIIVIPIIILPALATTIPLYINSVIDELKLKLKGIFQISLKAQTVFAISYLIGVVLKWQGVIKFTYGNVNDRFAYQSLLVFVDNNDFPTWLYYPLQTANITELSYILILAWLYSKLGKLKYINSLAKVLLYYGIGLIFWIVFVVFISITYY